MGAKERGRCGKVRIGSARFFARLEAEAHPAQTIEYGRRDERFYQLAVETVIESMTPRPYEPLKLHHEWLHPMLRRDPLNLSAHMRSRINAQPRVLRGFFDDLFREVKRTTGAEQNFADRLKADPDALREHFDTVFARYEREQWRWVDPGDLEVQIRARFLRFLSLGGDDFAPVHESRLELRGAYVDEDLDLSGCTIPQPLLFSHCHFAGQILLQEAVTKTLKFGSSHVRSIAAESAQNSGGVLLDNGFCATRGVSFPYARIEGRFSGEAGTLLSGGASALDCTGARIIGDVDLKNGFLGEGEVSFASSQIGGELNCSGGTFRNPTEDGSRVALDCRNAEITGNVVLADGFQSSGAVFFSHAKISGDLDCTKGTFCNRAADGTGTAIVGDNSEIEGDLHLKDGFSSEGQVRFYSAHVKGSITCYGSRFDNAAPQKSDGSSKWRSHAANAISLVGSRIDQVLWLGPHGREAPATAYIGSINLAGCHAHEFVDHSTSWPSKRVMVETGKRVPTHIILDGFTYDRFVAYSDFDVTTRKRWLDRQPIRQRGVRFRPQPFEQLIKVYREMGHNWHAREIAKFKERRRYRSLFIKLWHGWWKRPKIAKSRLLSPLNTIAWPFALVGRVLSCSVATIFLAAIWAIVGFGTAYWYGWGRLILFLLALWASGSLFYREVAVQGSFAPSNPVIYLNKDIEAKCARNWTDCKGAPPELPSFSPLTYSLDIMLPVLDLGQKHNWPADRPARQARDHGISFHRLGARLRSAHDVPHIRIDEKPLAEGTVDKIVRAQTLLSWGVLGLLIAMLSGLIKKD